MSRNLIDILFQTEKDIQRQKLKKEKERLRQITLKNDKRSNNPNRKGSRATSSNGGSRNQGDASSAALTNKNYQEGSENNFGDKTCHYYSGHLYKDILENFPGRLSKKIFNKYKEYTNNTNLVFYQLKYDEHGYDYYVRKVKSETQKTA